MAREPIFTPCYSDKQCRVSAIKSQPKWTVEKFSLVCRACRKETNDICRLQHKTALGLVSDGVSPGENPEGRDEKHPRGGPGGWEPRGSGRNRGSGRETPRFGARKPAVRGGKTGKPGSGREVWYLPQA